MSAIWTTEGGRPVCYKLTADSNPSTGPGGLAIQTGARLIDVQTGSAYVYTGSAWAAEVAATLGTVSLDSAALTALELIGIKGADGSAIASNSNPVPISDAGGSVTVDYATTGSGNATGALRIELANNGTGRLATVDAVTAITNALPAGANAIGKLAANSGVDIGDVDVTSIAAGTNLIGKVYAKEGTDLIYDGTTALTPKFAVIDVASSGDNTILAAVASKKIRVLSLYLVASAAVTVRFESGAGGTALSGQLQLTANGGFVLPYNPLGWFETASNTLLNLELSGATSVDGGFVYIEV